MLMSTCHRIAVEYLWLIQNIVLGGGHIGLESPRATKREAEGVVGERSGGGLLPPPADLGI